MRSIWVITKRELASYFDSLIAQLLIIIFLGFAVVVLASLVMAAPRLMLMTSAPWSARVAAQSGPETTLDKSTTRIPVSGPLILMVPSVLIS